MSKKNALRFGTLNLQGGNKKKNTLADDMVNFKMAVICTTETRMSGEKVQTIKTTDKKKSFHHYISGKDTKTRYGVGIVVETSTKADFQPINDRICKLHIETEGDNPNVTVISAYAPTEDVSKKNPEKREEFYDILEQQIKTVKLTDMLVVGGDFNAKTGSGYKRYKDNMGKHGKGKLNDNGYELLDLCARNDLVLTNTMFKHKLAHVTTWQAPEVLSAMHKDGTPRRNPVRNQIDYVMVRKANMKHVTNSRSYSSMSTRTDHRMVIADIENIPIKICRMNKKEKQYDFNKLNVHEFREQYKETMCQKLNESENQTTTQEKWDHLVKCTHETSKEILGYRKNGSRYSENPRIKELSEKQRKLQVRINNSNSETCASVRRERNNILNEIHRLLEIEKHNKILKSVEEVEKRQEDSGKMYAAIRIMQGKYKKVPLVIETKNGFTTHEKTQVDIITEFYKKQFNQLNVSGLLKADPCEMRIPFEKDEIEKAIKKLGNNKAAGIDGIKAEHLKNSPEEIPILIAEIFNEIARTGERPNEIKVGILNPLVKDKNKQGPCKNLRPVILLSMLRKILALCLIERIGKKIEQHIPHSQTAYQKGRSTTEQVFVYKILAEKAISSKSYTAHILLMDMSKAFDMIDRDKLMDIMRKILKPDELHLVKILLEQVEYCVKVGNTFGEHFKTTTGSPQGDCLSALFFILYLAMALGFEIHIKDHSYALPRHLEQKTPAELMHHDYSIPPLKVHELCKTQTLNIDTQYADDCGHAIISDNKYLVNYIKATIPALLKIQNLLCNESKNEEHTITRENRHNGSWRTCKYLGSLLDTKCDIQRRKILAIEASKLLEDIWKSNLTIKLKMKIFDCLVRSIYMYNSCLWTVTVTMEKQIDAFQRKLLRIAINIRYPKIIKNTELIELTKQTPWSQMIAIQRLRWFGHLQRLPEESPAKQALNELERVVDRPVGRPIVTWIEVVKKQMKEKGLDYKKAITLTQDRVGWRQFINS